MIINDTLPIMVKKQDNRNKSVNLIADLASSAKSDATEAVALLILETTYIQTED